MFLDSLWSKMEGYSFSRVYILFREFIKHTGRVDWDTLYIKYFNYPTYISKQIVLFLNIQIYLRYIETVCSFFSGRLL